MRVVVGAGISGLTCARVLARAGGDGGAGITVCWGCAQDVAALIGQMRETTGPRS